MPLTPIKLQPGINSVKTATLNQGGFSAAQNIRFFEGLPQKGGGFVEFCRTTIAGDVPHALRAWAALSGVSYLGIGGQLRLSVFTGGSVYDITPMSSPGVLPISVTTTAGSQTVKITEGSIVPVVGEWFVMEAPISAGGIVLSGAYGITAVGSGNFSFVAEQQATVSATGGVARQFTTTAGSAVVAVLFPNHGLFNGQETDILSAVAVGGLRLMGGYLATVVDANNFTITAASPATSAQTVLENGGDISLIFVGAGGSMQASFPAMQYSLANWGEFLMACPENGPVYLWQPAMGTAIPAANITTAPQSNSFIFVAIQAQQLVCCGTVNRATGLYDPMLLAWSDTGDYTDFVPEASNAGSFRLAIGSRIVAGIPIAGQNLIWTDLALYSMQYIQPPLVWGFQPLGVNCGAVGVNSVGIVNNVPVWMSKNQFYILTAEGPHVLPCPVWDQVFPNADRANFARVTCQTNSYFNEVGWSVPQLGGGVVFAKVQLDAANANPLLGWTIDAYGYTAASDQSPFGAPLAGEANQTIIQLENGTDAAGTALPVSLTTGMILISEGEETTFVREVIPDIKFGPQGGGPGAVMMTGYFYDQPNSAPRVVGPVPLTTATTTVPGMRGRARQVQFEFTADDLGTWWRLGDILYRGQPDGRR